MNLSQVGSRTGARTLGSGGCSTAFAVVLNPAAIVTFPAPASSNAACGFPALLRIPVNVTAAHGMVLRVLVLVSD